MAKRYRKGWRYPGRERNLGVRTVEQVGRTLDLRDLLRQQKVKEEVAGDRVVPYILTVESGVASAAVQLAGSTATVVVTLSDGDLVVEDLQLEQVPLPRNCGVRHYWRCPSCRRRCLVLYFDTGRRCLSCRRCAYGGLKYRSQGKSEEARLIDRAAALRSRLGGARSLREGRFERPRYMHASTHRRLVNELRQAENEIYTFQSLRRANVHRWAASRER
jgi:hypothetical protein